MYDISNCIVLQDYQLYLVNQSKYKENEAMMLNI